MSDFFTDLGDFFRAFCKNWISAMSGALAVLFWAVYAVAETQNYPASVRVCFIIAAALGSFIAAFLVWRHEKVTAHTRMAAANETANQRITALEAEIARLRILLSNQEEELIADNRAQQAALDSAQNLI
jgi:hypothetical protein